MLKQINTKLLIVPYGIETSSLTNFATSINELLIVPYGIETNSIVGQDDAELFF